ncbi:hypothetical protein HBH98_163160 [Parastagonospora nodorum]|nr:hypothetical protein HBH52_183410 [Parastagonospora nodorum]KAH3994687.1 hypothetical protein HBI10_183040 [Parastagonospora nodorum]KAH4014026.1 hypothetical protein HBI13_175140 [Parastagonospora nodorum]KAH4073711.1 hypothetical protein HBH50_037230 [Parastagonospora nodorum]KAH4091222.1 hypothetical protein HBH48_089550 [Parastagonospora nodorum]
MRTSPNQLHCPFYRYVNQRTSLIPLSISGLPDGHENNRQLIINSTCDYIIVGGGLAGVTIASRLKQYLFDSRITLLEAGTNAVEHPKINHVSDGTEFLQLMADGLTVVYSTTPQPCLDNRQIMNPAGRLLSDGSGVEMGN